MLILRFTPARGGIKRRRLSSLWQPKSLKMWELDLKMCCLFCRESKKKKILLKSYLHNCRLLGWCFSEVLRAIQHAWIKLRCVILAATRKDMIGGSFPPSLSSPDNSSLHLLALNPCSDTSKRLWCGDFLSGSASSWYLPLDRPVCCFNILIMPQKRVWTSAARRCQRKTWMKNAPVMKLILIPALTAEDLWPATSDPDIKPSS